jgi:hypothetical protein
MGAECVATEEAMLCKVAGADIKKRLIPRSREKINSIEEGWLSN